MPEYILKYNTKEQKYQKKKEWKYLKLYLKVKCIGFWSSLKEQHNIYFTKQLKIQNCCFLPCLIAVYIEKGLSH